MDSPGQGKRTRRYIATPPPRQARLSAAGPVLSSSLVKRTASDFVCMLRASSRAPGLGALLRAFPKVKPDAVWKAGGTDPHGRRRRDSGFTLFVAAGPDWKEVVQATSHRLRTLSLMVAEGRALGARFHLDFAVAPDGGASSRQLRFPAEALRLPADLGVELSITTYALGPGPARRPRRR